MSMRVKYESAVAERLTDWRNQLDSSRRRAHDVLEKDIDSAITEWTVALVMLEELKASGGGHWGIRKTEVEAACRRIAAAVARVRGSRA